MRDRYAARWYTTFEIPADETRLTLSEVGETM